MDSMVRKNRTQNKEHGKGVLNKFFNCEAFFKKLFKRTIKNQQKVSELKQSAICFLLLFT
jgi:hypothetical protein